MPLSQQDMQRIREEEEYRQKVRNSVETKTESYLDRKERSKDLGKLWGGVIIFVIIVLFAIFGHK